MADILIRPPDLRQISERLRASAQKIGVALQAIDNDLLALKGSEFLGNRADMLRAHYAPKRDALQKARDIVSRFAIDLRTTADVFEKADAGSPLQAVLASASPLGAVLGASTQQSGSQSILDLLRREKDLRALLERWAQEHGQGLEGWTLEKVNNAMEGIRRFIADLERGVVDMKNPKDLGHWLMNLLTTADEEYIKSSEVNIAKMQELLQIYQARKDLLTERAGLESQLADIQHQKDAALEPYLSITDTASRQDFVNQLPAEMRKEFLSGPRTITNAPLQIPAGELDRDSYTAILNQFVSSNENPRYASDTFNGVHRTYCDVYVRDVLRSTGVTVGDYGSIDTIARDLGRNPQWEVVSAEEAQLRANAGTPAVALMDSRHTYQTGNVHGAMIAPSDQPFNASRGPQIAQAGANCYMVADNRYMRDGFGRNFNGHVVYYALKD